jgi:hypothetical protein
MSVHLCQDGLSAAAALGGHQPAYGRLLAVRWRMIRETEVALSFAMDRAERSQPCLKRTAASKARRFGGAEVQLDILGD